MYMCFSIGYKLVVKGWRDVPVDLSVLGSLSADFVPTIKQVFVQAESSNFFRDEKALEDVLYAARREIQVLMSNTHTKTLTYTHIHTLTHTHTHLHT